MRTKHETDPDRSLVLACQEALREGRPPPFRELCERHYARVYRWCLRALRNESDARDACQDTFQCVLRRISGFQHRSSFVSWLHSVTRNCCCDLVRVARQSRACLSRMEREAGTQVRGSGEDSCETRLLQRELQGLVEQSIARLTPSQRSVIVSRYFAQCSYDDIAVRLGISVGTVKSRLARAHELLKDQLTRRLA